MHLQGRVTLPPAPANRFPELGEGAAPLQIAIYSCGKQGWVWHPPPKSCGKQGRVRGRVSIRENEMALIFL